MPIDACTSTFAEMAAIILPGDMAKLRAALAAPLPMFSFCKQGFGVRSILSGLRRSSDFSGCYVLLREGKPFYVGISRTVVQRLRQHVTGNTHFDASLAYQMATEKTGHKMKRADAMQDTAFRTAFEQAKALLRVSFRQACVVVTTGLTLGSFGVAAYGCEHPVDLVNRKGLGIKIIADPVAHFFVPFVVGVVEGLYKIVESGDASTIFRWTRELTIRAGRIRDVRINGKPLLQDDTMLPDIAKIIRVDGLGADPPQYAGEAHRALVFHGGHSHEPVFRVGTPYAPLANGKFVHVAVVPPPRSLQHVVQLRQSHFRGYQQTAPDRWARAEQGDLELIDFRRNRTLLRWHI